MKYHIEIDTEATLLETLNSIEASLRENRVMLEKDTLIAITDNPLDPSSVTISGGITISALDNPNTSEVLSVMPHDGSSVTLDTISAETPKD